MAIFFIKKNHDNPTPTNIQPSPSPTPTNIQPSPSPPKPTHSLPIPIPQGIKGIYVNADKDHNFNTGYFIRKTQIDEGVNVFTWIDSPQWTHSLYPDNLGNYISGINKQVYFLGPSDNSGNFYQFTTLGKAPSLGNALTCNITTSKLINVNNAFTANAVGTVFIDADTYTLQLLFNTQSAYAIVNYVKGKMTTF